MTSDQKQELLRAARELARKIVFAAVAGAHAETEDEIVRLLFLWRSHGVLDGVQIGSDPLELAAELREMLDVIGGSSPAEKGGER